MIPCPAPPDSSPENASSHPGLPSTRSRQGARSKEDGTPATLVVQHPDDSLSCLVTGWDTGLETLTEQSCIHLLHNQTHDKHTDEFNKDLNHMQTHPQARTCPHTTQLLHATFFRHQTRLPRQYQKPSKLTRRTCG